MVPGTFAAWMPPHRRMAVQLILPIGKRPEGTYAAVSTALADECAAFV
jgi:hypothetical protein